MKTFSLSYDLRNPDPDYQNLYKILIQLGAKRSLLSKWVLRGNYSAFSLRNELIKYIAPNDSLVVEEIVDCASWNTKLNTNKSKSDAYWEGHRSAQRNSFKLRSRILKDKAYWEGFRSAQRNRF